MDNSNFWWQAAGVDPGPGPSPGDPGDPIGQSLRFRGGQRLTNSTLSTTGRDNLWTLSLWIKTTNLTQNATRIFRGDLGPNSEGGINLMTNNSFDVGHITVNCNTGGGSGFQPAMRFRDTGAWQNWILVYNGRNENINFWVNGEAVTAATAGSTLSTGVKIDQIDFGGTTAWEGYLADVYFIDGQALDPTAFGRFNANGVWVPRTIDFDGVWGANGFHLTFDPTQDPDPQVAIGMDSSGNNNHFTATGFNTDRVGVFTDDFFTETGNTTLTPNWDSTQRNFLAGYGPELALNGNTNNNSCVAPVGNGWIFFRREFTGVTSLRVFGNLDAIGVNNEVVMSGIATGSPHDLTAFIPANGTITSLASMKVGQFGFSAIEINGTILVNNTGEDYDLMQDSPTQNYATLNPLRPGNFQQFGNAQAGVISDANLHFTGTGGNAGLSSNTINTVATNQSFYFEAVCNAKGSNTNSFFAMPQDGTTANAPQPGNELTWGSNGNLSQRGGSGSATGTTWDAGDVIRIRWDAANNIMGQAVNDGAWTTFTAPNTYDNPLSIGVNCFAADNYDINFGQKPWVHGRPDGFEAVQTQNLPAATIANGRDHFQAITGPGQGADSGVAGQLGGNWSSYFVSSSGWKTPASVAGDATYAFDANLSTRATTNLAGSTITFEPPGGIAFTNGLEILTRNDQLVSLNDGADVTTLDGDSGTWTEMATGAGTLTKLFWSSAPAGSACTCFAIRINPGTATEAILVDANILAIAQQTFPNGLWWIKDRVNSNQHQLVDSVRGSDLALTSPTVGDEDPYQAPAGDSVAWCWKAGDAAVANNDGSIASQVSANTDAGFSIVSYTGTGANATIGHGLNSPPEFALVKNRDGSQNWAVGGDAIDNWGTVLYLNNNQAKEPTDGGRFWNNLPPTDSVVNVGIAANTNKSGANFIAYYWHSVPGYSAFGSYTGNGSTTGDGPFVYTGHRSAFVLIKSSTSTYNWVIYDSERSPNNPNSIYLFPNDPTSEPTSDRPIDLLSNGFKIRTDANQVNRSGETYIWASFAENPFQSPVTAR